MYKRQDIARQICGMVPRWGFFASFLHPVFSASHVQHIPDLYSKFALGPHHVSKYGRPIDIQPAAAEIRLGKKRKKIEDSQKETTGQKHNGPLLHRAAIIMM